MDFYIWVAIITLILKLLTNLSLTGGLYQVIKCQKKVVWQEVSMTLDDQSWSLWK
jgi:hypothetical protein